MCIIIIIIAFRYIVNVDPNKVYSTRYTVPTVTVNAMSSLNLGVGWVVQVSKNTCLLRNLYDFFIAYLLFLK